jgi:hypothetical protein
MIEVSFVEIPYMSFFVQWNIHPVWLTMMVQNFFFPMKILEA